MAALMTSVLDNSTKVAEYILTCRQMGIQILPPDINEGESGFSVSGDAIRYGLSAIKSVGRSVVDAIIEERRIHGRFTSLDDFVERMSGKEINRRTLENFIKAGAMDTMPGNRRQKVMIAPELLEQKNKDRKNTMAGQMSLFDFAAEEEKEQYQITMPKVEEFRKEEMLAFEKEIMGVYVSGHPMDEYVDLWKKNITARTTDFIVDEETGRAVVSDGDFVTIGGIITDKIVKTTKNGTMMAFLTVEDMIGSVEVLVFSRQFESRREAYTEGTKAFFQGQVSIGDDPVGKLRLNKMITFEELPRELWLQFADKEAYLAGEQRMLETLRTAEGNDTVVIWLAKERARKVLPANWRVAANRELIGRLEQMFGEKNVKVVEKGLKRQ
jgi:DNA polymerase-3 subunit alpha